MCSVCTKSRVRKDIKPVLEKLDDLGSMKPEHLSQILYNEVDFKATKADFTFMQDSVSLITNALRGNQVNVIIWWGTTNCNFFVFAQRFVLDRDDFQGNVCGI